MSREELIALLADRDSRIAQRDARIAAQDTQIATLSTQVANLVEANEELAAKLARLEHLLTRIRGLAGVSTRTTVVLSTPYEARPPRI